MANDITIRTATPADFPGMLKLLMAAFSDAQPAHGLFDLIKHYKLDMQVKLLVNLVAHAMVTPEAPAEPAARRRGQRHAG